MPIDSQVVIALASGLAGTLVGAFITELGSLFRTYRDNKKVLRRVLYNQLDLWLELRRADVGFYLPLLLGHLKIALQRRGADPELIGALFGGADEQLRLLFRAVAVGDPAKVAHRYQESVNQLAELDPILAHRLSGSPDAEIQQIEDFIAKAKASAPAPAQHTDPLSERLVTEFSDAVLRRAIQRLERDMVAVSKKIHPWTRYSVARLLREFEAKMSEAAAERVEVELDQMLGMFQRLIAPGTP